MVLFCIYKIYLLFFKAFKYLTEMWHSFKVICKDNLMKFFHQMFFIIKRKVMFKFIIQETYNITLCADVPRLHL